MATVVLSAAGAAIAGPFGAALGSTVGRQIDRTLSGSGRARLSDLRVQTSQYGAEIPLLFGMMRVAGVLIWALDLVETTAVSKTGSTHSYNANFALALSCGRVSKVGRIWADGRLIRDSEERQLTAFTLRLHDGGEDQAADPLIASQTGYDLAPAYRGLAYVVFEDFDLSTFGNRIPQITFEVETGVADLSAEAVISRSLQIGQAGGSSQDVVGFALTGDTIGEALEPLAEACGTRLCLSQQGWQVGPSGIVHSIDVQEVPDWQVNVAARPSSHGPSVVKSRANLPTKFSVRYFDPAIDFAAGEKSARSPGPERLRRIELPAAMSSSQAKALAHACLASAWQMATERWIYLPLRWAFVAVGDELQSGGDGTQRWLVREKHISSEQVSLRIERAPHAIGVAAADAGGRAIAEGIEEGTPRVLLAELPMSSGALNRPVLAIAWSGGPRGWRPQALQLSLGGISQDVVPAPAPAAIGKLTSALATSASELLDRDNVIDVAFDEDPMLISCDEPALLSGANLLLINQELLQFGTAERVDEHRYRLRHLLRCRHSSGSGRAHAIGDDVLLLRPGTYASLETNVEQSGAEALLTMMVPDGTSTESLITIEGLATRPWSPVHPDWRIDDNGLTMSWSRRSRLGLAWLDSVDVPLDASRERYRIRLRGDGFTWFETEVESCSVSLLHAELARLGAMPWECEIQQLGDYAIGTSLTFRIE